MTKAWLARWVGLTSWGIYGSGPDAQRLVRALLTLDKAPGRRIELLLSPEEARSLAGRLIRQAERVDRADACNPLHAHAMAGERS